MNFKYFGNKVSFTNFFRAGNYKYLERSGQLYKSPWTWDKDYLKIIIKIFTKKYSFRKNLDIFLKKHQEINTIIYRKYLYHYLKIYSESQYVSKYLYLLPLKKFN